MTWDLVGAIGWGVLGIAGAFGAWFLVVALAHEARRAWIGRRARYRYRLRRGIR